MKSILFIIMTLFLFNGCVTMDATPEQAKQIGNVKEFPILKKDDLYKKTLVWAARVYTSSNDVIQYKDQAEGKIICKGLGSISELGFKRHYSYTLIIDIKDKKIRTSFENIKSEKIGNVAGPDINYQWDKISENLIFLRESLYKSIQDNGKESDKNW